MTFWEMVAKLVTRGGYATNYANLGPNKRLTFNSDNGEMMIEHRNGSVKYYTPTKNAISSSTWSVS